MFRLIPLTIRVQSALAINRIISFFCHIPLIRIIIRPGLVKSRAFKFVCTIFGATLEIIERVVFRLLYVLLLVLFGVIFYVVPDTGRLLALFESFFAILLLEHTLHHIESILAIILPYIMTAWFFINFAGSFGRSALVRPKTSDIDDAMITYLRANPAKYARSRILSITVSETLLYLPFILLAFMFGPIPVWCAAPMMLMFFSFRLFGEAVNMLSFRLTKRHFGQSGQTVALVMFAIAFCYTFLIGTFDWSSILQNPLTVIITAVIGLLLWVYICTYSGYAELLKNKIEQSQILFNAEKTKKTLGGGGVTPAADVTKWHKGINAKSLSFDKYKNKEGFSYLNALFFSRHSKFFRGKMTGRIVIALAPLILAVVAAISDRYFGTTILFLTMGSEIPFRFAPVFFLIMYFMSMGRVVTLSVFSNCDIHMLHYAYYRTKETTIASFRSRFMKILKFNVIGSAVMSLSILGTARIMCGYMDYQNAVAFMLLLFSLGVLFAFNDLFLYYVMQPYDVAGKSKSTMYSIINLIIYLIAFINLYYGTLNSGLDLIAYTGYIAGATILYLGLGTVLLRLLAPKKFKLR